MKIIMIYLSAMSLQRTKTPLLLLPSVTQSGHEPALHWIALQKSPEYAVLQPLGRCLRHISCRFLSIVEGFEIGIGLLQSLLYLLSGESVRFNLREYEVFGHFEEGLGHKHTFV
jgi:hypothetical protein